MMNHLQRVNSDWDQAMIKERVGLLDRAGNFAPLPVSLSPWRLTASQWQQAQDNSRLLGRLLSSISNQGNWLLENLNPLISGNSLTGILAKQLSQLDPAQIRAVGLPLMRHDMLLDTACKWRWVESNSIAAGMGPLSDNWQQLLKQQQALCCQAENPAIVRQSALLAGAAVAMRRRFDNQPPLLLFVVEQQEDNLFDQQILAEAIQARGVRVARVSLAQLAGLPMRGSRLYWPGDKPGAGSAVDLVYFRTGYNRQDYQNAEQLALRATLETLDLVLCPNIALQLAGSKWVQARIYENLQDPWTGSQFQRNLSLSLADMARLHTLLVPAHTLTNADNKTIRGRLNRGWLLKSEQEGGGSVLKSQDAIDRLDQGMGADTGWIVMAPIDSQIRQARLTLLKAGQWQEWAGSISELGIFTLGHNHQYGGYLLRSKPAGQLEGGVHRGGAVLDSLQVF